MCFHCSMHVYTCVRVFLGCASVCGHNIMAWLLVSECVGVRVSGDAGSSCVTTTHSLSSQKSALQWVLHMTGLSLPSPQGLYLMEPNMHFFSQLISVNESIFNGCPKCRDLAENVILLLPMCMRCSFIFKSHKPLSHMKPIKLTNYFFQQMYHICDSHMHWLYVLSMLLPFTLPWNTKIKELLSIWEISHPLG